MVHVVNVVSGDFKKKQEKKQEKHTPLVFEI